MKENYSKDFGWRLVFPPNFNFSERMKPYILDQGLCNLERLVFGSFFKKFYPWSTEVSQLI